MRTKIITKAQYEDILFDGSKQVVESNKTSADCTITTLTVNGKVAAKRLIDFTGTSYVAV